MISLLLLGPVSHVCRWCRHAAAGQPASIRAWAAGAVCDASTDATAGGGLCAGPTASGLCERAARATGGSAGVPRRAAGGASGGPAGAPGWAARLCCPRGSAGVLAGGPAGPVCRRPAGVHAGGPADVRSCSHTCERFPGGLREVGSRRPVDPRGDGTAQRAARCRAGRDRAASFAHEAARFAHEAAVACEGGLGEEGEEGEVGVEEEGVGSVQEEEEQGLLLRWLRACTFMSSHVCHGAEVAKAAPPIFFSWLVLHLCMGELTSGTSSISIICS